MKKRCWLFYIVLLCLLMCALALGFLFGTTGGARLLIAQAARFSGTSVEYNSLAGRLGHDLSIQGLRIRLPGLTLSMAAFRLTWQPLYLASGRLAVKEISARDVVVEDARPDTPIDLTWPSVPAWAGLVRASIEQFRVDAFSYRVPGDKPVDLQSVRAPVLWEAGALLFDRLEINAPSGSIQGSLAIGLIKPSLRARLKALPTRKGAYVDGLSLEADLTSTGQSQPVSGKVFLTASWATKERFRLESLLAVSPHAIDVKEFSLRKSGLKGAVTGNARIDLSRPEPEVALRAQAQNLDVSGELNTSLIVSGSVNVTSDFRSFRGDFDLRSSGEQWKRARLAGIAEGTFDRVRIRLLHGSLLDGQVEGELLVATTEKLSLEGRLQGTNLNPAAIRPDLKGKINLKVDLKLEGSDTGAMDGNLDAELLSSTFLDRPLTGRIRASMSRGLLTVAACEVHGNGFDLSAHGALQERLMYEIRVRNLAGLIPDARGRVSAGGWIGWADGMPAGVLKASGSMISVDQIKARTLDLEIYMEKGLKGSIDASAKTQGLGYGVLMVNAGTAEIRGTAGDHTVAINASWSAGSVALQGQGAYSERAWRGTLNRFDCRSSTLGTWKLQRDVSLFLSSYRLLITPFMLATPQGEQIDLAADLTLSPRKGSATLSWRNLNVGRMNPFLSGQVLEGQSTGSLKAESPDGGPMRIAGSISATGKLTQGAFTLEIDQARLNVDWNDRGLLSSLDVRSRAGAVLQGTVSSPEPPRATLPQQAMFQMAWEGLDLAMLKPFYPSQLALGGRISGKMNGEFLPEKRFNLQGETSVSEGKLDWRTSEGLMTAVMQTARVTWAWRDATLRGKADLVLSDFGRVNASFLLPVMACFPMRVDESAPVQVSASGELRERGVLSALFPGLIQESKGAINFAIATNGTWSAPALRGNVRLTGAGAYLPSAGIHLQDAGAEAVISENQIRITSFAVRSGPGSLKGSATVSLKDWRVDRLEGTLTGERFQVIYLPELQALIEPELRFDGKGRKLFVQGTIKVPELRIQLPEKGGVRASPDVILTDKAGEVKTAGALELTSEVRIILGNKVTVQAMGINARLDGNLLVKTKGLQDITAQGEIRIPEGQYSASGVKLDVIRGTITFTGGPPERAILDVLALKKLPPTPKVKEVKAGVIITGSLLSPVVKLYSDPAMADADVLSYILTGRPRSTDTEQAGALARAAAAIAAAGPSSNIESRLGLDMLDVTSPKGDTQQTYVSLGKYLSPLLYVGLGYSLFQHQSFLIARYTLSKSWEIESQSGAQLAADLYFKIEFY